MLLFIIYTFIKIQLIHLYYNILSILLEVGTAPLEKCFVIKTIIKVPNAWPINILVIIMGTNSYAMAKVIASTQEANQSIKKKE